MRSGFLIVGAALLAGCLTTPVQRVESLGKGKVEVAVEGGASLLEEQPTPAANIAARVGVSDRVDLGLRVGSWLYEVQAKVRLTDDGASVPVSLAPSTMVLYGRDPFDSSGSGERLGGAFLNLPVLVGVPLGRHQLVLGPGANTILAFAEDRVRFGVEGRMSVGLSLRIARGFRVHPEIAVGVGGVTLGDGGTETSGPSIRSSAVIGFAFGNATFLE